MSISMREVIKIKARWVKVGSTAMLGDMNDSLTHEFNNPYTVS